MKKTSFYTALLIVLLLTPSCPGNTMKKTDPAIEKRIDAIISQMDVGLVPVMWEDNLPQVAIEMHARHVPLLTSDLGGAQELANFPEMVFKAGDVAATKCEDSASLLNAVVSMMLIL